MEPTTTDTVARMFELWRGPDQDAFVAGFHPECEIWPFTGDGPYRGRRGVLDFLEESADNGRMVLVGPPELLERGDSVLAIAHVAVFEDDRLERGALVAWVVDIRDGLVWRLRSFTDVVTARRSFGRDA